MRPVYTAATDEELAAAFLAGDHDAFHRLVLRHQDKLHRFVCWTVNAAEAEDLTQEVFVEAYRSLRGWRREALFRTWLYGIGRNICRRHLRDQARRRRLFDEDADIQAASDPRPGPLQRLGVEEHNIAMLNAIGQLSAEHRVTLMLRAWEGLPYAEIAELTGVPKGTVRSRLHNARRELAKLLEHSL